MAPTPSQPWLSTLVAVVVVVETWLLPWVDVTMLTAPEGTDNVNSTLVLVVTATDGRLPS